MHLKDCCQVPVLLLSFELHVQTSPPTLTKTNEIAESRTRVGLENRRHGTNTDLDRTTLAASVFMWNKEWIQLIYPGRARMKTSETCELTPLEAQWTSQAVYVKKQHSPNTHSSSHTLTFHKDSWKNCALFSPKQ